MSVIPGLPNEVELAAKALGLLDAGGNLDAGWFQSPDARLRSILSNPTQRAAFLSLLAAVLPPENLAGLRDGEEWHPLLGDNPDGNVFLITRASGGQVEFGFGGELRSTAGAPAASLRLRLPVISAQGENLQPIAGTNTGPLEVDLRVELNWRHGTEAIGLRAVRVTGRLTPVGGNPAASLAVTLEQLDLDGTGAHNTVLDPEHLDTQALDLIVGLVKEKLRQISAGAGGEEARVANHLETLLGLDSNVPRFPFAGLTGGPSALQGWLNQLIETGSIVNWLSALGSLLGANVNALGTGTAADPWRVKVGELAGGPSGVEVTFTRKAGPLLDVGLNVNLVPAGANPRLRVEGRAALASIPLGGAVPAAPLPFAEVVVRAPGDNAETLVAGAAITVKALRAGVRWDGNHLVPLLEMLDVTFGGTDYERIDLTNTDSVAATASNILETALRDALGNAGAGRRLAALAGLMRPERAPASWPHTLDPVRLVTNPTAAVAGVHRAALLDPVHNWSFLLAELAYLLGLANPADTGNPVQGTGQRDDPWRVPLAPGPLGVELVAWNEQTSGVAADTQLLRIGLRASATRAPLHFWWLADLLAFDLPAAGDGDVRLMAGQHVSFQLTPVPAVPARAGIALTADAVGLEMDWTPGGEMSLRGVVTNLNVTAGGPPLNIPSLTFPPPAALDVTNPVALGIPVGTLETLFRQLLANGLSAWAGRAGATLASLLGLHPSLDALPTDWPLLRDPLASGSMFSNPPEALRDWLNRLVTGVSADGEAFLPRALAALRVLLADAIPAPELPFRGDELPVEGGGTYEDPWTLALSPNGSKPLELLAWLEPQGPPPGWANSLAARVNAATNARTLVAAARKVADFSPGLRGAFAALSSNQLADALTQLDQYLSDSDGVVPLSSQVPTGGTWTAGAAFQSAHHLQPSHASAIAQVLAQVNNWEPGARVVLLLGPAFGTRGSWGALLSAAEAADPGTTNANAHFNLRLPGVDPLTIDLASTTAVADYYTADLQDGGTGDLPNLSEQISRLATRLGQLRPGVPLIIVAHSTAGVAARVFTASNPGRIRGLITIGAPHSGASLLPIRTAAPAQAVRWLSAAGLALSAGPLRDAVAHLVAAIDGYLPPAAAGELPRPFPYPVGSFAGTATADTGGVAALALGSTLGGSLLDAARQALATAAAAAAAPHPAPTHLSFGLRASLGLPPTGTNIAAFAKLRVDAFRFALQSGAAEPARPPHALRVEITVESPGGWIVGTPYAHSAIGSPPVDVRLRRAELSATLAVNGDGALSVTPRVRLFDAAFRGPLETVVELGQPTAAPLLGALFQKLSNPTPLPGSGLDLLLDALQALGLAVPDPGGGIGLSAEALAAVSLDGAAFLGPRLRTAFDLPGGVGAFSGPPGGPWVLPLGGLGVEVYVSPASTSTAAPTTVGVRTQAGSSLSVGLGSAEFDLRLHLPAFGSAANVTAHLGAATLVYTHDSAAPAGDTLTLAIPPWLDTFELIPAPTQAEFTAAFNQLVPRLMLSSAVTAFFENVIGPGFSVGPIDVFLASPGSTVSRPGGLGNGTFLDATRINQLLQDIGRAIGAPAGPGLTLPGDLRLTASGTEPITLRLETLNPIGGVAGFQLDANIDRLFHVTPAGQLTLRTPLPGTWPSVELAFGISPGGVTLAVLPQGTAPIQLLPTFSGFGSLALAGAALLPSALDELVNSFGAARPTLVNLALDIAEAFNFYDDGQGFAGHSDQLRAALAGGWLTGLASDIRGNVVAAVAQLFTNAALPANEKLPGVFTVEAGSVVWSSPAADSDLKIVFGWDAMGPTLVVEAAGFPSADSTVVFGFRGGYASGSVMAETTLDLNLETIVRVTAKPRLSASFSDEQLHVRFLPLGEVNDSENAFHIDIAPTPAVHLEPEGVAGLVGQWLLPLVADALLSIPALNLNRPLWTGGPSVLAVLEGAGVVNAGNLVLPLPAVEEIITGALVAMVNTTPSVAVTPTLSVRLVSESGKLGARLTGTIEIQAGDVTASVLFGDPQSAIPDEDRGVTVYLLSTAEGQLLVDPALHVIGFGLGLAGRDGAPLVNTPVFRLGGFAAFLFFDVSFLSNTRRPQLTVSNFGAGALLERFGIPLGNALGQNMGGNNPVAASLLSSNTGTPGGSGDPQPVNPEVDVFVSYLDGRFAIRFGGTTAIWIPVQRAFGPIYIDQLGVVLSGEGGDASVALLVDGSVKVAGLTVQADDLGVNMPLRALLTPAQWTLELRGLAVGFQQGTVTIAGGLLKDPGPPVQYAGMLLVNFAGRGLTAVGAYARPSEGGDSYTSFFAFAALSFPIGGPPYFFVLGLGGGIGYNRRLIIPEDVGQIGNFLLVSAIDGGGSFANDPMGALRNMLVAVPPSRGGLWLAAGIKFTSFALIEGIAVIYIALDRGDFEIGLLGLARMALPRPEFPIAMVELALRARFSTAEMLLSVQAQLTDNSFIFHRSCRLTGGFAFCIWFRTGEVVLTLGGYHPAFAKPAHFPVVPRLGFHWSVADNITLKGEAYFALTTTCVMAGGRLEASARFGPIRAWFIAYADFLVSWEPFYYTLDIGISVGVEARLRVCFFFCKTFHISVSVGAQLHLEGPPLHGTVTVEYWVIKVTIPFGERPRQQDYLTWTAFKQKYLIAGDQEGRAVGIQLVEGLVPPEPPGGSPAPGTQAQPWKLGAEFAFTTETRMPADSRMDNTGAVVPLGLEQLDIAPAGKRDAVSIHTFGIFRRSNGEEIIPDANHWTVENIISPFPEATWRLYEVGRVPAASRNIRALSGLNIKGVAFLHGQSALIKIVGMVDDDSSRSLPLPFTTLSQQLITALLGFGVLAETFLAALPAASVGSYLGAAETVLANAQFAGGRLEAQAPERGLSPLSIAALRHARSAPPRIEPLSLGLTMKDVGLPDPPEVLEIRPERPVILDAVRLRAVFGTRPQVSAATPASVHTTVKRVAPPDAPRMRPPRERAVPGARLHLVAPKGVPSATAAPVGVRSQRSMDVGFWQGKRQRAAFVSAAADVLGDGVRLPSGVTHVWELPAGAGRRLTLEGGAAARVAFGDNGGAIVGDVECVVVQQLALDIPGAAARVFITCLGETPPGAQLPATAPGAVSLYAAPAGAWAATGWQSGNHLLKVSTSTYLCRGGELIANRPLRMTPGRQSSSQGLTLASEVVAEVPLMETRLPAATGVVAVLLDRQDASAAAQGDLTIAASGAELLAPPHALGDGSRRVLLYDVGARDEDEEGPWLSVTVGSRQGWRVAGVVGLAGRAAEWGARFTGDVPESLVPEGPLTPTGSLIVRFTIEEPR